jgi:hypothetical protein
VSTSQLAVLAPASLAAFSILDLHMPQLPETLNVSVLAWAIPAKEIARQRDKTENNFIVFIFLILIKLKNIIVEKVCMRQ